MNNADKVKKAIRALAKTMTDLKEAGGPEGDGKLFEEYMHLQENILQRFGLPASPAFANILVTEGMPTDTEIEGIIEKLSAAATEYLLSPAKTDTQMLEEAIEEQLPPEQVLPYLGITMHLYTNFVYNDIFLAGKADIPETLAALKLGNDPKNLRLLGMLALSHDMGPEEAKMRQTLEARGVPYLQAFLDSFEESDTAADLTTTGRLAHFWRNLHGKVPDQSLEDKFTLLSGYLMNALCLVVGGQPYRITEVEVYYHDAEDHPDPYVHRAREQLFAGNWYFNGFGLDITFGDFEKKIYGGLLIRGIMKFGEEQRYINGPGNVLREIFNALGNVVSGENAICLREIHPKVIEEMNTTMVLTTRVGLKERDDDADDFAAKKYRYIVDLNLGHKFKGKEMVVKQLLEEKMINAETAKAMLGYNLGSA